MSASEHMHNTVAADDIGYGIRGPRHHVSLIGLYLREQTRYLIKIFAHSENILRRYVIWS
jgi:hypothetical protein